MTAQQLSLPVPPHRNRRLFSDHYLDEVLPHTPEWRQGAGEAAAVLARVRELLTAFQTPANEAQTEHDLVRPVLEALGHQFEVQPALQVPGTARRPDYLLYQDAASRDANRQRTVTADDLGGALAVADAKFWGRRLDQAATGGDPFTNKNPGYQISFYIQHTGLPWGILTNGRLWRLYHKSSAHKLEVFYEIDLPELVEAGSAERFQYFLRFFGREAFAEGPLSLRRHLAESEQYARKVGESLKQQVYEALRHVAQGFLDFPGNGLQPDEPTLREIYDHSLILLYRLLFVLYAEARGLLPVEESLEYRDGYSLQAIKRAIARELDAGRPAMPHLATRWSRLKTLFDIINHGDPPLQVATFNGGLFDPHRHPFLERHAVGDARLRAAVDRLARVERQFVDYRDLSERHLGTIYEGLLEFHLRALPPDAPERDQGWTVELVTDRGERKASGSYYTPGFITRFMVEQAVGPVVDAALERHEARGKEAQAEAVLALNVLDCSMGSGHFLVETAEYLARRLVEADLLPPSLKVPGEAPDIDELAYWKRRAAQACLYGVDLNPLAVDLAKLSLWLSTAAKDRPLSFLDHHLRPGNALVGARLADLEQPVPKKTSGTAAKRREKQEATGQLTWAADSAFTQDVFRAVGLVWEIQESPAATVDDVKAQEIHYEGVRQHYTERYIRLADVATAARFGLQIDPALWRVLADYATGRTVTTLPQVKQWVEEAETLARQHRFFHWELEFPEVFFDRYGRSRDEEAGFDVVIGNPPYVRQERLAPLKPYLKQCYQSYHGVADLYVYFCEQGFRLLREGGRMSYIVNNKWLRTGYGADLRGFLSGQRALERLIDFGHAPIFPEADAFPCVVLLEKPKQAAARDQAMVASFPRELLREVTIQAYVDRHSHEVPLNRLGRPAWNLDPEPVHALFERIGAAGVRLQDFIGSRPYRGVLTGLNEAFLLDDEGRDRLLGEDPGSADIVRPYLRGQSLKRWVAEPEGLWMILLISSGNLRWPWTDAPDPESAFRQAYPAVYRHLKPLEPRLRTRQDKGRYWWELRSCSYYHLFEQPKLLYQEIQFHPSYCFDGEGYYSNNKAFLIPSKDLYLLAVLNSPLMWWHNWRFLPHMKDEALSPVAELMENLPIASPTAAIRADTEEAVARALAVVRERREKVSAVLDWLAVEMNVAAPGQALQSFAKLEEGAFVQAVRKARPREAGRLDPAALQDLRGVYRDQVPRMLALDREIGRLEMRIAALVNQAFGLTVEDVALMWETAPPRMPLSRDQLR